MFFWIWRSRLSAYEAACRLDSAAGLKDRVSTAIYLGNAKDPDEITQYQRRDAVARLAKVDARGLFPFRKPAAVNHVLALVLVVGGLFAYRANHKAPVVDLRQSTARFPLVQSTFSPIVQAMEKDLERTLGLVTLKPDLQADEVRPGDALPTADDLWQPNDEKNPDTEEAQPEDTMDAANADSEGVSNGQGDQPMPSAEDQQNQNANAQSQDANAQGQAGQQGDKQSVSQSLMRALKNMMSKSPNQDRPNQQQNPQGAPQNGANQQSESDNTATSRGAADSKQSASQTAGNSAGDQPGTNEMRKDQETLPVNALPDKVALDASGVKDQTRMRVETETGTARLTVRDVSPGAQAAINGAGQENVPARYRLYVQRYFEYADDGKQ